MNPVRSILAMFGDAVRVHDGHPAPVGRWDPPYACVIATAAIALILLLHGAYNIHSPLWQILMLGFLGLVAGFLSRQNEGETMHYDHTLAIMVSAGALHGPTNAAALTAAITLVASYPQRRIIGGWSQYLLGVSNTTLNAVASAVAFAVSLEFSGSIIAATAAAVLAAEVSNLVINVGWCLAGGRSLTELVKAYREEAPHVVVLTVYIAASIAGATVEPLLIAGLLAPVVLNKLNEIANARLRKAEAALKIDGLTSIYNRSHFWERLSSMLRAADARATIGLLMLDIDNFKILNDTHGHVEGDEALRATAKALQVSCPEGLVARYGGEEFGVILSATGVAEMFSIAERLRAAAEQALRPWGTTISIGGALSDPAGPEAPEAIVSRADNGLYRSKLDGKNRFTFQSDRGSHARVEDVREPAA